MKYIFLLASITLCTSLMAQNTIKGTYDPINKTFSTKDTIYYIGSFTERYAIIPKNNKIDFIHSTGRGYF